MPAAGIPTTIKVMDSPSETVRKSPLNSLFCKLPWPWYLFTKIGN